MRLSELADAAAFEDGVLRVSQTTYHRNYQNVTRRLVEFFGDVNLHSLTPVDVVRWQEHLVSRGLSIHTANSYKSTARAMLNQVGKRDLAGVIRLRKPPPAPVEGDEAGALLRNAAPGQAEGRGDFALAAG